MVLDSGPVGGDTTGAAMGHIVLMDSTPDQFTFTRYSHRLWQELSEELPASVEFSRCGTLWIAADEGLMKQAVDKANRYRQSGVAVDLLDDTGLQQEEPSLRHNLHGALQVEADAVIYPPAAARFLLDCAVRRGVRVQLGTGVRQVHARGEVILDNGHALSAGTVIIAAGCRSGALVPGLPVYPRKGHLVITERYPQRIRHQLVELGYVKSAHTPNGDSIAFNIQPRKTGQLLIGSSRQNDNTKRTDYPLLARMLRRASTFVPDLDQMQILRVWTGLRPATTDTRPLIGPLKDRIWLATGHEGLGITLSLGTGRIIADMLVGREPQLPVEPYLPTRLKYGKTIHA